MLTIPLFLGSLALCAVCTYLLGPWAAGAVGAVGIGAIQLAIHHPAHREAAVSTVGGALVGFGGVMLIALLHYLG